MNSERRTPLISKITGTPLQIVTPEGVLRPAKCNARATHVGTSSKLEVAPPQTKIHVTSKFPVGNISVVTLIRTDTTLDHSQKAEKVCSNKADRPSYRAHSVGQRVLAATRRLGWSGSRVVGSGDSAGCTGETPWLHVLKHVGPKPP